MRERLHTSINLYISNLDPELAVTYRIFVRAYAALDNIPQGHLTGLFAGFSSADPHFDFTLLLNETFVEERINGKKFNLTSWMAYRLTLPQMYSRLL